MTKASLTVDCGPRGHAVECGRQENLVSENEIKIKHIMNPIWGLQVPMLHCWTSLGSKHTTCIVHAVSPCNGTKHFLRYLSSKAIVCYEAQDFYCTSNPSTLIKRQRFNCRKARLYSYCPHPSSMHQVSVSLIGWSYSV